VVSKKVQGKGQNHRRKGTFYKKKLNGKAFCKGAQGGLQGLPSVGEAKKKEKRRKKKRLWGVMGQVFSNPFKGWEELGRGGTLYEGKGEIRSGRRSNLEPGSGTCRKKHSQTRGHGVKQRKTEKKTKRQDAQLRSTWMVCEEKKNYGILKRGAFIGKGTFTENSGKRNTRQQSDFSSQ